jgi:hypothetical protein
VDTVARVTPVACQRLVARDIAAVSIEHSRSEEIGSAHSARTSLS